MKDNKFVFGITIFLLFFLISVPSYSASVQEERAEILKMESDTLNYLYSKDKSARRNVQNAAGYAVFSNFGMKIFVLGSGKGSGVAVNNKTKKKTYMKMVELQAGLGFGVKKFTQQNTTTKGLHSQVLFLFPPGSGFTRLLKTALLLN